ncbi:MAG: lactonase family protein [Verrucomicrobiae bacterium]
MIPFSPVLGREARFYLGTYTSPARTGLLKSSGIYVGGIDLETGRFSPVRAAGECDNPSFLALSPDGRSLYAAAERSEGAVAAFHVGDGGDLTLLNELPTGGGGTCYVSVDATGRSVFAANYSGASFAAFDVTPSGALVRRTALIPLGGSGPHRRQAQSFAHAIDADRANRFVYGCDLGSDTIWCLKPDAASGGLSVNDPIEGKVPAGSGPRHLAFSARGDFAYVCNELSSTVTVFACQAENGALTQIQTVPLLPEGTDAAGFGAAEIAIHPAGKWLYVSDRDTTNEGRDFIAAFSIASDGRISCLGRAPTVRHPRSFAIDPSGRWIVVAGMTDHKIATMKINAETGALEPTGQQAEVPAPTCVIFDFSPFQGNAGQAAK